MDGWSRGGVEEEGEPRVHCNHRSYYSESIWTCVRWGGPQISDGLIKITSRYIKNMFKYILYCIHW